MRDDDLTFVELVQRELHTVRWPEPAELRSRARRRSRLTVVAAAVSVLAVAAGSAVAVAAHTPTAPTVAAVVGASAERAGVPQEALLAEADLPVLADMELGESGAREPVEIDKLLVTCAREQGESVAPVVSRHSRSRSLLRNLAAGQSNTAPMPLLTQDLYRVEPGAADRVFTDLDRFVTSCSSWRQTTPVLRDGRAGQVSIVYGWQVTARDFAGDRAVLLRHTEKAAEPDEPLIQPESGETVRMVVQVGDLITVFGPLYGPVSQTSGELPLFTDDELRGLARTAAERMCAAANPPC
ncbi:hypothetical protein [Micromonospora sp. CA-244673]|uniref:hypothetical protein n=1 Tax=Micromonospora sp. CA-244673 TaxID=3239958 RepID=UPI003D8DDE84